jgi:hypothetical protein
MHCEPWKGSAPVARARTLVERSQEVSFMMSLPRLPLSFPGARRPWRGAAVAALLVAGAGCSSLDLEAWRARGPAARAAAERQDAAAEDARVQDLRARLDLAGSRHLALTLAAERPEDPSALRLASRAESDQVFLLAETAKQDRSLAALSALDFAERASRASNGGRPDVEAQLAWALGTTTHLQPMFSRSGHARRTLEVIEKVLAAEPDNVTALATLAVLRLRLATLPWIARAMAWGAPEGSVDEAVTTATRCVAIEPSVEHRLILARALLVAEKQEDARAVLEKAVASGDSYPRDRELRADARRLLETLEPGA